MDNTEGLPKCREIRELSTELESQAYNPFRIREIYDTKSGGEEWFMNMDGLLGDPRVMNTEGENIKKKSDGSWESDCSDNGELRLEAWSPDYSDMEWRKAASWLNVEITHVMSKSWRRKRTKRMSILLTHGSSTAEEDITSKIIHARVAHKGEMVEHERC